MKTIILFREGLSGHYFKSLVDDSNEEIKFRVDPWHPGIYDNYSRSLDTLKDDCKCLHPHLINTKILPSDYDLLLTIHVKKKVYVATYNNFYKKFLIENPNYHDDFKNWQLNAITWYDRCFYNIKEYYGLYQQDLTNNTIPNIIEFDCLLDVDYIEQVFQQYFNRSLTDNMRRIVKTYSDLQLQYDLSGNENKMEDIVLTLPDSVFQESPWFASYCIFKYETNNNLQENQRQWSVDLIKKPIDKAFLISIQDRYQL